MAEMPKMQEHFSAVLRHLLPPAGEGIFRLAEDCERFSYDSQPAPASNRMQSFRYLQLDVFPARPGGGNPLGVVIDARGWSAVDMQRFAAWTNLVETTFLLPPDNDAANYRLR